LNEEGRTKNEREKGAKYEGVLEGMGGVAWVIGHGWVEWNGGRGRIAW
jgi:hypothetical protein